mmetsp:Transcript_14958/g.44626  ORF Transcript_14958/g.44626 Transcript_14958/m.44626 type:complete len:138 (+) Transcript_14958:649-1062(+)
METYSAVTRFCLICNYVSRIIEPLVSRCAKMRFTMLDAKSMQTQLKKIAAAETLTYEECVYDKILEYSQGDMRRAVTLLQSCVNFHGKRNLVASDLEEMSGDIPVQMMRSLWSAVESKDSNALTLAANDIMQLIRVR